MRGQLRVRQPRAAHVGDQAAPAGQREEDVGHGRRTGRRVGQRGCGAEVGGREGHGAQDRHGSAWGAGETRRDAMRWVLPAHSPLCCAPVVSTPNTAHSHPMGFTTKPSITLQPHPHRTLSTPCTHLNHGASLHSALTTPSPHPRQVDFATTVAPALGATIANAMFLSGLPAVNKARKDGDLGDLNPLPFPIGTSLSSLTHRTPVYVRSTLLASPSNRNVTLPVSPPTTYHSPPLPLLLLPGFGNCLGWLIYGLLLKNPFVVAANFPGLLLASYVKGATVYHRPHTSQRQRRPPPGPCTIQHPSTHHPAWAPTLIIHPPRIHPPRTHPSHTHHPPPPITTTYDLTPGTMSCRA